MIQSGIFNFPIDSQMSNEHEYVIDESESLMGMLKSNYA